MVSSNMDNMYLDFSYITMCIIYITKANVVKIFIISSPKWKNIYDHFAKMMHNTWKSY